MRQSRWILYHRLPSRSLRARRLGWLVAHRSDPAELEAAILNLAINARDATPEGGKLTIKTSNAFLDESYTRLLLDVAAGQYVLISMSDKRKGILEELGYKC